MACHTFHFRFLTFYHYTMSQRENVTLLQFDFELLDCQVKCSLQYIHITVNGEKKITISDIVLHAWP